MSRPDLALAAGAGGHDLELQRREHRMMGFLFRLAISALGLWLASVIVPGIRVDDFGSLVLAALLLGIVNALVRPILFILTLPFTILTLGLFLLVINAAMLGLVAVFLGGFNVHGFVAALLGSIVVSLVSWVGHTMMKNGRRP
jgi:putative membrane protein